MFDGNLNPRVHSGTSTKYTSLGNVGHNIITYCTNPLCNTEISVVTVEHSDGLNCVCGFEKHVHVYNQNIVLQADANKKHDADCERALTYFKACACGEAYSSTETWEASPALGHNTIPTIVEATCMSTGSTTLSCTRCSYVETNTIPKDPQNHIGESGELSYSYYQNNTHYIYKVCRCGSILPGQPVIGSCNADAEGNCVCGQHTHVFNRAEANEDTLAVAATCKTPAQYYYSCNDVNCTVLSNIVFDGDLLPHEWIEEDYAWYRIAEENCMYEGEYYKHCANCDTVSDTETFTVPKNMDLHFEENKTYQYVKHPDYHTYNFTCTCGYVSDPQREDHHYSYIDNICQECGANRTDKGYHSCDYVDWMYYDQTYHSLRCTICSDVIYEEHVDGGWVINDTYHVLECYCGSWNDVHQWNSGEIITAPTFDSVGQTKYTCTVCGFNKTETISNAGLYDEDGKLVATWDKLVNEYGFNVEIDYDSGSASAPGKILKDHVSLSNGKKLRIDDSVTRIGQYAFIGCDLTDVVLGENVEAIANYAFMQSSDLSHIVLNVNLNDIGFIAFSGCTSLEQIDFQGCNPTISQGAFEGTGVKELVIPPDVQLYDGAFGNCDSLTQVTIQSKWIADYAFSNCDALQIVILDVNSVIDNEYGAIFMDCDQLAAIYVKDSLVEQYKESWSTHSNVIYSMSEYENRLEPGLYNNDGDMIATWNELVNTYGMDIEEDFVSHDNTTNPVSAYYVLTTYFNATEGLKLVLPNTITHIGSGVFNGYEWPLEIDFGVGLQSIGYESFTYSGLRGDIVIPSTVTSIGGSAFSNTDISSVVFKNNVESLGYSMFSYCDNLSSVTLPDNFTQIQQSMFAGCENLKSIILHEGMSIQEGAFSGAGLTGVLIIPAQSWVSDSSFSHCTNLTDVIFKGDRYSLASAYSFYGCTNLKTVTIESTSVAVLLDGAFSACPLLEAIYVPSHLVNSYKYESSWDDYIGIIEDIQKRPGLYDKDGNLVATWDELVNTYGMDIETDYTMNGAVTAPEYILGTYFSNMNYYELVIDKSVYHIGSYAFYSCNEIYSVVVGDYVTSIGDYAFSRCESLSNIVLTDNIKVIGEYAFSGCIELVEFTVPAGVSQINEGVFENCTNLMNVLLHDNIKYIEMYAFAYCSSLDKISLPDNISLYNAAFLCSGLTEVALPNGAYVGDGVFANCEELTVIYLGNLSSGLGPAAFQKCINLTTIVIQTTSFVDCTYSQDVSNTFDQCTNIKTVLIHNDSSYFYDYQYSDNGWRQLSDVSFSYLY